MMRHMYRHGATQTERQRCAHAGITRAITTTRASAFILTTSPSALVRESRRTALHQTQSLCRKEAMTVNRRFRIAIRNDGKQDTDYAIASPRVVHENGSV